MQIDKNLGVRPAHLITKGYGVYYLFVKLVTVPGISKAASKQKKF